MIIRIPSNFPLDALLEKWKAESTYKVRLQSKLDTLYIILNEFYRNDINLGWAVPVRFHSTTIRTVCGRSYFDVMRDLQSSEFGSILSSDHRYKVKGYSKGYTLRFGYCYSGDQIVELHSGKTLEKYRKYVNGLRAYQEVFQPIDPKKKYLMDQFKGLNLTLDERIDEYLKRKYNAIKSEIQQSTDLKYRFHLYAIAGKLANYISLITKNSVVPSISRSNHRLNSLFTLCPKELRYFLRINNRELLELDIKASHPYVLTTILNYEFFTKTQKGFNLKTIYPEIYYSIQSYIEAATNLKYTRTEAREVADLRSFPHLCADFYKNTDIQYYKQINFENDFYLLAADLIRNNANWKIDEKSLERNHIKLNALIWLNSTDPHKRKRLAYFVNKFKILFPSIESLIQNIGFFKQQKSAFSILLQRVESHLILDIAAKPLIKKFPSNKIFTIHDCFLIENHELDTELAIDTIKNSLKDYTGYTPGVTVKKRNSFEYFDEYLKEDLDQAKENTEKEELRNCEEEDRIFNQERINEVKAGIYAIENQRDVKGCLVEFEEFLKSNYCY